MAFVFRRPMAKKTSVAPRSWVGSSLAWVTACSKKRVRIASNSAVTGASENADQPSGDTAPSPPCVRAVPRVMSVAPLRGGGSGQCGG